MTLSRALSNAHSGLATTSRRADITSNNVANANTPGYVRRSVIVSERIAGTSGNGVAISGIDRAQDYALTRSRRDADSANGRVSVLASTFKDLNRELGEADDSFSLFSSYADFESGLKDLAVSPESSVLQNNVLSSAKDIVNQFNELSLIARNLRSKADGQIAKQVDSVNSALHRIQELNGDIGSLQAGTEDRAALEDERQRQLDVIADIIPIKDYQRDNGQIDITTDTGVVLLAGNVNELSFRHTGIVGHDVSYDPATPGPLSGLFVGDQELTPLTPSQYALSSGSIAGHFAVRDKTIPDFTNQLDSLAADLITRLSSSSVDPTLNAGEPGMFTDAGDAYDPTRLAGLASRLSLNAALDPVQGGSATGFRDGINAAGSGPEGQSGILNGVLNALSSLSAAPAGTTLSGGKTFSTVLADFTSDVGSQRIRHDNLSLSTQTRANSLRDSELAFSAVDTDAEMQSLLQIEQSYAANARVVQTVNDMLDRLMQL